MPNHVLKGNAAPVIAPSHLGQMFIDETNRKPYCGVGVAAPADFLDLLPAAAGGGGGSPYTFDEHIGDIYTNPDFTLVMDASVDKYYVRTGGSGVTITVAAPTDTTKWHEKEVVIVLGDSSTINFAGEFVKWTNQVAPAFSTFNTVLARLVYAKGLYFGDWIALK